MNIIVCIKQVPVSDAVQIDTVSGKLKRDSCSAVLNPYDEYAIEEAVRIKEKHGGEIFAVSMGPQSAESSLREAIARGADRAFLVSDKLLAGSDVLATSYVLSCAIKTIGIPDIIICGKQSSDAETACIPAELSELLNIAFVPFVKKIDVLENSLIRTQRTFENGYAVFEAKTPILVSVVKEINIPRIVSLRGRMNAKKAEVKTLDCAAISADTSRVGLDGSPTKVAGLFDVVQSITNGEKFSGDAKTIAKNFVEKLSLLKLV